MSPQPAESLVFTVNEFAAAVRLCPKTVRRLIRNHELVARGVGSKFLIPRTSVEAFLRRDHATRPRRK